MNTPPLPAPARRTSALAWLLLLLLLPVAAWLGWQAWQAREAAHSAVAAGAEQRLAALEGRIGTLVENQRAQAKRLQQADATNRVLRDELLGIGQRAALLEDSIGRLADPDTSGAQALRLDEVELLLAQGAQRLQLAGDLDGTRRAYALAAQLLDGIADPGYIDLRQALAQERAALEALGSDPKLAAAGRLEAFAASLPMLPAAATPPGATDLPWWQRVASRIVEVRPSDERLAVEPADRAAGLAALQLELALARASIERRDADGYRAALTRADAWMPRLWPDSPQLRQQRKALQSLRTLPLAVDLPTLGTTLQQIRSRRSAG